MVLSQVDRRDKKNKQTGYNIMVLGIVRFIPFELVLCV